MLDTCVSRCLILACCLAMPAISFQQSRDKQVTSPPRIHPSNLREQAYKIGEQTEIPCVAEGEPAPNYEWTHNGNPLEGLGSSIRQKQGVGTIVFPEPLSTHEGVYQCKAKNEFGIAVSINTKLKKAFLMPFPTVTDPKIHRPLVGSPLMLDCRPPGSYPQAQVYWAEDKAGSKFKPIEEDERISVDYDGNLYFANVLREDERDGKRYVCIVQNTVIRSLVQGDDQLIEVTGASETPPYANVHLNWSSPSIQIALKDNMVKMKCIFSGNPTPTVTWTRTDKPMPSHVQVRSFGKEIFIPRVDIDDEGRYRCEAVNRAHSDPVHKDFTLRVQSMPFWTEAPEDVHSSEEEEAEFTCKAGGAPKPEVTWYFNGIKYEASQADTRKEVTENRVYFRNLTKTDAQVIQCNASNEHGYIFTNAFLNVLAEPPSFIEAPDSVTKAAEEQDVVLKCRVFGAPKPVITWKRGDPPQTVSGPRFEQTPEGDLRIRHVDQAQDEGTYTCHAINKFGDGDQSGSLVIRNKTEITVPPKDQTVNATADVTFQCQATTDEEELSQLKYTWLRNGEEIDFTREGRLVMNMQDYSLTIRQASVGDTAQYTCKVDNGIDSDQVSASLTVKDRPDSPYNVRIHTCSATRAEVQWIPGSENNDPVSEFIMYYNTTFDEPGIFHEADRVAKGRTMASLELSPWANYTFHVKARNGLGLSDASDFTQALCQSPSRRPYKNPDNVCVVSEDPHQLIIVWDAMPRIDHNGDDFRYVVRYERYDLPGEAANEVEIYDWEQTRHVVSNVPTFVPFKFSVEAKNSKGTAPSSKRQNFLGHSGEDTPIVSPEAFRLDPGTLNATSARFLWEDVDRTKENVRGHFKGYRILFWKSDDPDNKRQEDVILANVELCVPVRSGDTRKRREAGDAVSAHTHDLWPFSKITAGVQVLNNAKAGGLSDTIEFETPEGVPGMVEDFEVTETGSHHLKLQWLPPLDRNGILTGYTLGYKPVNSINAGMEYVQVLDPLRQHKKIHDLEEDTPYIIYIWGLTGAGMGETYFIEARTKVAAPPDVPVIGKLEVGHDFVNASWAPTEETGDEKNPGSEFYIKYRKVGEEEWEDTKPPEKEHNWINITDLETGTEYEIVVVAVNGKGQETPSEPTIVEVGRDPDTEPTAGAQVQAASIATWFIVIMIILIFLIIVIIIICLIRRNRGGKYPVHEKEKLAGRDPEKEDEEAAFGEYTPKSEPKKKKVPTATLR